MPKCPNCDHDNMEGVLFCEQCGFAIEGATVATRQLVQPKENSIAGGHQLSEDHVILLHVKDNDEPLALQVIDRLVLGREGGFAEVGTFVSLEKYAAGDLGVSRNHAALIREKDQLLVRDLGSTNHTYLNGQRLSDNRKYALRDGDEVTLGKLTFRLFFK